MSSLSQGILVGWYGDDFTGSAAVMEVLTFSGVPSVLFLEAPSPDMLARFPDARAIGIASTARSQSPGWMEDNLTPALAFLDTSGARVIHYKTCSTLDSAPEVGSIGAALDIGMRMFGDAPVPCLVAAPVMRRYQAFGHLFASAGEQVYRLDRHPVMARHPVTPMRESDVARHIGQQTLKRFGTVSVEDLAADPFAAWKRECASGAEVITLDAMTDADMAANGALIWEGEQRFAVGSQGVEYALIAHWREAGMISTRYQTDGVGEAEQVLVVSGSVSPTTAEQIDWAERNGFDVFVLDPTAVLAEDSGKETLAAFRQSVFAAVAAGRDVVVCSARGPDDPSVARLRSAVAESGIASSLVNRRIGAALGQILETCVREFGLRRAVVSGGDTSGYATEKLGIYAFSALAPTIPGASLLTAHSDDPALDGLQIALKGGQMGSADFFGWIKRGGGAA
ncbi:four-carbon acid sugar kinase family protein [Actibacterium pelagium]|uniref:Four-carbon acid sugar kinase family protein n=1 Tax=Actibacterium pelagium TaxID=2029103 RepID=A0A917ELB3_9RHOB|nr:four-carbon acid sugar kinase family protein [Actibacterium pelagium]GGE58089.1 hypothetical protein GCM10011517_27320 [Actibacterium pelagium]